MQIFNTEQIHAWDAFTIAHEPIASIDLMERAATACFGWLTDTHQHQKTFSVFCGKGNNGGDGLAIARMLANTGHEVNVYILEFGHKGTDDFQQNLARLHGSTASVFFIPNEETIPDIPKDHVIVDAIFGSGLNRPLDGLTAVVVDHINNSGSEIISIDIPTGMFADTAPIGKSIVHAAHTLTFQTIKLAFLFKESQPYIGTLHILDIGLHPGYPATTKCTQHLVDYELLRSTFHVRKKFSHKGDFGYGGLVAGSKGMMGAAVLAAKGFMRSGAGKLTCHIPEVGYTIMQTCVPEAMSLVEKGEEYIESIGSVEKYDAIGIGPGIGIYNVHAHTLSDIFKRFRKPVVVDADALNILSRHPELLKEIPANSILTPHPKEFERLFGKVSSDFERMQLAMAKARELNLVIVVKGAHTLIVSPSGEIYFNNSGNPGMATGGSGDVLTGIITGMLCQGYGAVEAAYTGVFIHGLAGDIAAVKSSMQSLIASDIIDHLGDAFKRFEIE